MKYALGFLFVLFLLACTTPSFAQAQVPPTTNVPPPPPPPPASVDSSIDTDEFASDPGTAGANFDAWLQKQADELRSILGCYLSEKSLKDEVTLETKNNRDPRHLIEVRIALLKDFAKHNAPSHCK